MSGPCRCWTNSHALGHDGHCCFQVASQWRADGDECHAREYLDDLLAATQTTTRPEET